RRRDRAGEPGVSVPGAARQERCAADGRVRLHVHDLRRASGGTLLWTDTFTGVNVVGGAFSVKLGSGASKIDDKVLASPQLYLDVQVQGTQLAGRQQLLHVPYAANSSGDFRVNGALIVGALPD